MLHTKQFQFNFFIALFGHYITLLCTQIENIFRVPGTAEPGSWGVGGGGSFSPTPFFIMPLARPVARPPSPHQYKNRSAVPGVSIQL